jgi:predicted Zn finger-like uncharacterized protein
MDVRCERCQTEYEVEDASVSDLGTEVQCSDCGHLFTVKRSQAVAEPVSVAVSPVAGEGQGGGTWKLLTTLGQSQELRDLNQLHKMIIERRVTREDRVAQDGQPWQTLGTVAELVPFFDIVDSAERAHALEAAPIAPSLAPLQPPILTHHDVQAPSEPARIGRSTPKLGSPYVAGATSSGDSLGALPQATDIGETEMIQAQPAGARRLAKLSVMLAVAAAIGYGGIVWQKHYLRPAVISTSGATEEQAMQGKVAATATPTSMAVPAIAESPDVEGDADHAHGPVVEPLGEGAAKSPAAQGYAALNRGEYAQAIGLFKRVLAQSPGNGTALFGLAEAHRGAGNKQQALQTYRRYIDILPFGPDAGSARFQLRTLEGKKR